MSTGYSKEFRLLVQKYLNGTATEQEIQTVEDYYKLFSDQPDIIDIIDEKECEVLENKIKAKVDERIVSIQNKTIITPLYRKFQSIAAALVLLTCSISLYFYISTPEIRDQPTKITKKDIAPGTNKATLTLANGEIIILDDTANKEIASESGISITKTSDGQLIYKVSGQIAGNEVAYNKIETPKGGQYQVILPDSTRVWLNAESSLRYPTMFKGKEREVELTGEAYFEVEKYNNMLFIVTVNSMRVEVLGTHFNIMAYKDESTMNTTLLEGSVRVTKDHESKLIVPGQQVKVADKMQVVNVDTKEAVAWKNGYFLFRNGDIQSIMRKISRWYNVDVKYEGDISNKVFGGRISRTRNVSAVLKMLELTGSIHFKIEERRITVMP